MTFTTKFDRFVCEGDTITFEEDGFVVTATIERDIDANIDDDDVHNCDRSVTGCNDFQQLQILKARAAWTNYEWFYCGIVLSVSLNGFELADSATSLWHIEANYPDTNNGYLTEVANDLLDEALEAGKAARETILAQLKVIL